MEKLIAHRGWSGIAPENTLGAIKLALEEPKIEAIEIDVHLSKDGVPVVIHDHTVDRTTDGTGEVKEKTLEQLKELDAGSWFSPEFAGERIPTLEEVILLIAGRKRMLIELKQTAGLYEGLEKSVIQLLRQYGIEDACSLISFDHSSLQTCMDICPDVKRTLVMLGAPVLLTDQVNEIGASAVSMHYKYVDKKMIDSLKDNGTEIVVWTVDKREEAERLAALDSGISFTTNHPERLWS